MGTVSFGNDIRGIVYIIPPVNIVFIAVAVVIDTFRTVHLGLVHPDMGRQIFMVEHDSLVMHRHDDVRFAGLDLPCLEQVDVGTGRKSVLPLVVVMPLLGEHRVVERHLSARNRYRRSIDDIVGHIDRIGIRTLDDIDGFDILHSVDGRKPVCSTRHGYTFIETHVVPQMQAVPAAALREPAAVAEYAPHLGSTQFGRDTVHILISGLHGTAGEHPRTQRSGILLDFYPYPPVAHFACPHLGFGLRFGFFRKGSLLGTGSRRKGTYGHQ